MPLDHLGLAMPYQNLGLTMPIRGSRRLHTTKTCHPHHTGLTMPYHFTTTHEMAAKTTWLKGKLPLPKKLGLTEN